VGSALHGGELASACTACALTAAHAATPARATSARTQAGDWRLSRMLACASISGAKARGGKRLGEDTRTQRIAHIYRVAGWRAFRRGHQGAQNGKRASATAFTHRSSNVARTRASCLTACAHGLYRDSLMCS